MQGCDQGSIKNKVEKKTASHHMTQMFQRKMKIKGNSLK